MNLETGENFFSNALYDQKRGENVTYQLGDKYFTFLESTVQNVSCTKGSHNLKEQVYGRGK